MVTLTDAAGEQLSQILSQTDEAGEQSAIRIVQQDEDLKLTLDAPREGDESFEYQGKTILVLDQDVANLLGDKTLDVQSTEEGPQLTVRESEQE